VQSYPFFVHDILIFILKVRCAWAVIDINQYTRFIISAKWTKWIAKIMFSLDYASVCLSVCKCARSEPINQTVGALNANSYKKVNATDFKFDTRFQDQSRRDPWNLWKTGCDHGQVITKKSLGEIYTLSSASSSHNLWIYFWRIYVDFSKLCNRATCRSSGNRWKFIHWKTDSIKYQRQEIAEYSLRETIDLQETSM